MQIHNDILSFRRSIVKKVTKIVQDWSNECYGRHPVLKSFLWKQSLFSGPKNRNSVINGLEINDSALISNCGIKDFLFRVETEFSELRTKYPLFVNELESGEEIQLAEAIEELLDFFHMLCTPDFCSFFGNRFSIHVDRENVLISEIPV